MERTAANTRWTIAAIIGAVAPGVASLAWQDSQTRQPVFVPEPVQQPAAVVESGQATRPALPVAAAPIAPVDPAATDRAADRARLFSCVKRAHIIDSLPLFSMDS